MSNSDTPAKVGSSEGLGLVPKRNPVAWDLALLAQTLEFSEEVRMQCQRGHDEIERLCAALAKANEQAERFERGWYLRGDALESIQKHCEPQPSALAAAIVATCKSGLEA